MDLSTFIYDFNLVTTLTVRDIYESCSAINNGRKIKINYQNCISLYGLVEIFNKSYMKYIEDKDNLKNILSQLGKEIRYCHHSVSDDFTSICLEVFETYPNIFSEKYSIIYFVNNDGNYYVSANNGRRMFDKQYKSTRVDLDECSIISCLDFVKKHNLFLEGLRDLEEKFVFGNGTSVLFTKIDGDMFDKLSTFTLTFGNSYMNSTDYIEVKFRLGESLEIIYDESKVTMDDEEILDSEIKKKIINELISEIYINCDKLNGLYKQDNQEHILRKKENNEK